jgi:hypothetical protein
LILAKDLGLHLDRLRVTARHGEGEGVLIASMIVHLVVRMIVVVMTVLVPVVMTTLVAVASTVRMYVFVPVVVLVSDVMSMNAGLRIAAAAGYTHDSFSISRSSATARRSACPPRDRRR